MIAVICFYLLLPLVLTFLYSIFTEWKNVLPSGLTLKFYARLFSDTGFWIPFLRTLIISIVPTVICTVFILLAMYVVVVYIPWLDKYMQIICTIPYAIQGIILAIAVLSLYSGLPGILSNRVLMLTFTYCIVILPYLYRGIKNNLNAVNARQLIETAQLLGASRFRAFFSLIVPNILSGITVSSLLAVSLLMGDFVIINIIAGSYFESAQIYLYRLLYQSGQTSSAMICILFCVTLLFTNGVLLYYNRSQKRSPKEK
jgi:putative spermidine/putrescine transport system permease protein